MELDGGDVRRRRRLVLASVVALSSLLVGCAHSGRTGTTSRFVKGNIPDYEAAWRELNEKPEESLQHFIARVRRLAAAARPARTISPSIETQDPVLRDTLLQLSLTPSAENHWRLGEAYRRRLVSDFAYDHMREAVRIDRRFAPAWDGLARIWRDWGYPQYALGDAHRAVYFDPANAAYRNTLGTVLQAVGRRREARAAYEEALRRSPKASWALSNLCLVAVEDGRFGEAVALCEAAVTVQPGSSSLRTNLHRAWTARESARVPQSQPEAPAEGATAAR
jgi:tetratricopeptide (TPR) repeat protein